MINWFCQVVKNLYDILNKFSWYGTLLYIFNCDMKRKYAQVQYLKSTFLKSLYNFESFYPNQDINLKYEKLAKSAMP